MRRRIFNDITTTKQLKLYRFNLTYKTKSLLYNCNHFFYNIKSPQLYLLKKKKDIREMEKNIFFLFLFDLNFKRLTSHTWHHLFKTDFSYVRIVCFLFNIPYEWSMIAQIYVPYIQFYVCMYMTSYLSCT